MYIPLYSEVYSMISLHSVANLLPTSGAIAAPKVSITIQRLQLRLVPSKDSRGLPIWLFNIAMENHHLQ